MLEESSNSKMQIDNLDLLNINQAISDGILIDLSVVFSEYYKSNMQMLKLSAWKLLITKEAFSRYIDVENNFMAGLLQETKSSRFCEIIFYIYAKLKSSKILASKQTTLILEMPISVPQWHCAKTIESKDLDCPTIQPICTLKVLIQRQINHLIIMFPE